MNDAREATHQLDVSLVGVGESLKKIADIRAAAGLRGAAIFALDLKDAAADLNANFGPTVDQAQGVVDALNATKNAKSLPELADATAQLTSLLGQSKLKDTDLTKTILDAEDNIRQLNVQGAGIQGRHDAAIGWAKGPADQRWSRAAAAAAISGARPGASAPITTSCGQRAMMET